MHGSRFVQHWSSTQSVVALRSAEAELNAIVKRMNDIWGRMNMMKEYERGLKGQIFAGSSATTGIVHRQGRGKVKHLECPELWVQGTVRDERAACTEVFRG